MSHHLRTVGHRRLMASYIGRLIGYSFVCFSAVSCVIKCINFLSFPSRLKSVWIAIISPRMILLIWILEMNKNNGNYIEKEIILLDEYRMNILLFFHLTQELEKRFSIIIFWCCWLNTSWNLNEEIVINKLSVTTLFPNWELSKLEFLFLATFP